MSSLRSLRLEKFRTFKEETQFEFAPLTIITGPNSSGKSSVLKALLLLQESIRRTGMETVKPNFPGRMLAGLRFGNYVHGLKDFKAAHTRSAPDDRLKISIGIENALGRYLPVVLNRETTEVDEGAVKLLGLHSLGEKFSWPSPIELDMIFHHGALEHISLHDASESTRKEIATVCTETKFDVDEELLAKQVYVPLKTYDYCSLSGSWFRNVIGPDYESFCENLQVNPTDRLFALWEHLGHAGSASAGLTGGIASLYKLAPRMLTEWLEGGGPSLISDEAKDDDLVQRLLVKRFADFTVRPLLRQAVENFLSVLREMRFHQFLPLDSKSIYAKEEGGLAADSIANFSESQQRTSRYWMEAFGIGSDLKVSEGTKGVFTVVVVRDGEEIPLRDIGSGHRRLLPLLLSVGTGGGRHEGPLLIEEPEANLHPNLQSTLADLFVSICEESEPRFGPGTYTHGPELPGANERDHFMPNHQLIVETHSEYLIRRLQYLVATNAAKPEDIAIYYLGPDPEAEDYVKRITIAPSGKLSESFGAGFTDESTNLMIDLYKQTHQN